MIGIGRTFLRYRALITLLGALAIGLTAVLSNVTLTADGALQQLRTKFRHQAPSGQIVAVEIDSRSLAAIGRWPWPRRMHAALIEQLDHAGVVTIGFDIEFSQPSNPVDDAAFATAIAQSNARVIIGAVSERDASGAEITAVLPFPAFRDNADVAAIMHYLEADGVIRTGLHSLVIDGRNYPSMSTALTGREDNHRASLFPLDPAIQLADLRRISAVDILAGQFDASTLRGKTILIGPTAPNLGDRTLLFNRYVPGMFSHIVGAETLLRGLSPIEFGPIYPLIPTIGLISIIAFVRSRKICITAAVLGLAVIVFGPLPFEMYNGWTMQIGPSLLAFATALLIRLSASLTRSFFLGISTNELSGIPNAQAMHFDLAHRDHPQVAVARLHNLAPINSVLGDARTGELLRKLSERIALVSEGSAIYHVADQVFAWVVLTPDDEEIADRFEALHALMAAPVRVDQQPVDVTVTFGLSPSEHDLVAATRAATLAAERAKLRGLRWIRHNSRDQDEESWRLALLGELDEAIDRGQIWVAYQPKFDLGSKRIIGAEALVRWRHPERGVIPPDHFVPLAEQNGRIAKLTRFVLDTALSDFTTLSDDGRPCVAINMSTSLLGDPGLVEWVCGALHIHAVDPEQLVLEVTESAAMTSDDEALTVLARFRSMGMGVSIDDYGTGQSSLAYLKKLPATELKIDQSFVRAITESRSDEILVNSTIQLGHQLGMRVVAEGVETMEVLNRLEAFGCDIAQGYHIGKPMPFDEFVRRYRSRTWLANAA